MSNLEKSNVLVFLGAGFSAALTTGKNAPIGRKPVPTLADFSTALLDFMRSYTVPDWSMLPFSERTFFEAVNFLEQNEQRSNSGYDFEELLSILALEKTVMHAGILEHLRDKDAFNGQALDCLIYFIPRLLADKLALDGQLQKNRNLFYAVRDEQIVRTFQDNVWKFCDNNDATFVSLNYDGLLEAFLDCILGANQRGKKPVFRYFPEFSHGVPLTMPEHALRGRDNRDFSRMKKEMPSAPKILKPHGSIHFYPLKEEVAQLANIPRMIALHPRFDIGFDPKTMQRDIPNVEVWEFVHPFPFIIPPVVNKERYLSEDYSRVVFSELSKAFRDADHVISLGFSIPRSDLYITSMLQLLRKGMAPEHKKVALVWREAEGDRTLANWQNVFGEEAITYKLDTGLPVGSTDEINGFWEEMTEFLSS